MLMTWVRAPVNKKEIKSATMAFDTVNNLRAGYMERQTLIKLTELLENIRSASITCPFLLVLVPPPPPPVALAPPAVVEPFI